MVALLLVWVGLALLALGGKNELLALLLLELLLLELEFELELLDAGRPP